MCIRDSLKPGMCEVRLEDTQTHSQAPFRPSHTIHRQSMKAQIHWLQGARCRHDPHSSLAPSLYESRQGNINGPSPLSPSTSSTAGGDASFAHAPLPPSRGGPGCSVRDPGRQQLFEQQHSSHEAYLPMGQRSNSGAGHSFLPPSLPALVPSWSKYK